MNKRIEQISQKLLSVVKTSNRPTALYKSDDLKELYSLIPSAKPEEKAELGKRINLVKSELKRAIEDREAELRKRQIEPIDVTLPWNVNEKQPELLPTEYGSQNPLTKEIERVCDIFTRMGFEAIESRQIDDDYHMFSSLNFPAGHPARDGYDTFRTEEGFIPPAHTSTMENRILRAGKAKLESGENIAVVSYGRVYRNEDVDATHEHTFHQYEGMLIGKDIKLGNMIAILQEFFQTYYGEKLAVKTQPGYFPFTEPSLEFLIEKPKSLGGKKGDWLEMLGCGMTHPNVLKAAGIDPEQYQGFAWGGGIERLVLLKYGIDDIRHFESGKLEFLRKF